MRYAPFLLPVALRFAVFAVPGASADEAPVTISDAKEVGGGVVAHEVTSPFQAGKTTVRVLRPDKLEAGKRYTVVYVLPVEARRDIRRVSHDLRLRSQN